MLEAKIREIREELKSAMDDYKAMLGDGSVHAEDLRLVRTGSIDGLQVAYHMLTGEFYRDEDDLNEKETA